jgi:GT2 family glycosyltransferase
VLEALNGFDDSFGLRPAGEDTDLAWRAIETGTEFVFAPVALVRHAVVALSPLKGLQDAARWGECARLFSRHPQARQMLYRGVFWNVWHYLLLRSALSLLGPAWLRRLLLSRHASSLKARSRELGLAELWIPYLVLLDTVEAASMVRGALRHRTPLL